MYCQFQDFSLFFFFPKCIVFLTIAGDILVGAGRSQSPGRFAPSHLKNAFLCGAGKSAPAEFTEIRLQYTIRAALLFNHSVGVIHCCLVMAGCFSDTETQRRQCAGVPDDQIGKESRDAYGTTI